MKSKPTVIIKVDVPIKAREAVTRNEDGSYTVFLRPDLTGEAQLKALRHALSHIDVDWECGSGSVQDIEYWAHRLN